MDAPTRRRPAPLVVLLFGAAIGLLIGMVWAVIAPTTYTAAATVYVSTRSATVGDVQESGALAQRAGRSYRSVATSAFVLDPVIRDLGLQTTSEVLARRVVVQQEPDTVLLRISASDESAGRAAAIANAVAREMHDAASALAPRTAGAVPTEITVLRAADVPASAPGMIVPVLVGLLGGAGVAAAALLLSWLWRRRPPAGGGLAAPSLL